MNGMDSATLTDRNATQRLCVPAMEVFLQDPLTNLFEVPNECKILGSGAQVEKALGFM